MAISPERAAAQTKAWRAANPERAREFNRLYARRWRARQSKSRERLGQIEQDMRAYRVKWRAVKAAT